MCILKAFSATSSFQSFAQNSGLPVYSCMEKGAVKSVKKGTVHENFRISFDVSTREWDDFPGQVEDAIAFLKQWHTQLQTLLATHQVDHVFLDFPIYSRIGNGIANANDHLPGELIKLAGSLGLGIEMSYYCKPTKDEIEARHSRKSDDS